MADPLDDILTAPDPLAEIMQSQQADPLQRSVPIPGPAREMDPSLIEGEGGQFFREGSSVPISGVQRPTSQKGTVQGPADPNVPLEPSQRNPLDDIIDADPNAPSGVFNTGRPALDAWMERINTGIADALSLLPGAAAEALTHAGLMHANGHDVNRAIREGFKYIGVRANSDPAKTLTEKMGDQVIPTLLGLYGLRVAGPTMAMTPGAGAGSAVAREIGQFATTRPGTMVASGLAGIPGRVVGGEYGADLGERVGEMAAGGPGVTSRVGRATGEFLGGTLGDITTGLPVTIAERTAARFRNPIRDPMVSTHADPEVTIAAAQDSLTRQTRALDDAIANAAQSVGRPNVTAREEAVRLRDSIDRVYTSARTMEEGAWARVDRNVELGETQMRNIDDAIEGILQSEQGRMNQRSLPDDVMGRFRRQRTYDAQGRVTGYEPLTIGEALTLRSEVMRQSREAGATSPGGKQQANRPLQANLNALSEALLDNIVAVNPNNQPLVAAREFSRVLNDRFRRGPVGRILSEDFNQEARTVPELTTRTLLEDIGGFRALNEAGSPMPNSAAQPRGTIAMREAGNDAILAEYRQIAQDAALGQIGGRDRQSQAATNAVNRFMRDNRREIETWTRASTEAEAATNTITQAWTARDLLQQSALARWGVSNPNSRIADLMGQTNPGMATRNLMDTFRADPEAVEGFQRLMVQHLLKTAGKDMEGARILANSNRWQPALQEAFGRDGVERIQRILEVGGALQRGEGPRSMRYAKNITTWFSHIMGLHAGRIAANLTGAGPSGSLSLPAKLSSAFTRRTAALFAQSAPDAAVAQMMVDPKYEAMMMRRIPNSSGQANHWVRDAQRYVSRMQAAQMAANHNILNENKDAPVK